MPREKESKKKAAFTIYIDEALLIPLGIISTAENKSRQTIIEEALKTYLERKMREKKDMLIDLVKSYAKS